MKKKKLLFVISQFYKGGAEVSLLNLLKNLDGNLYDIDLMIMNQCPTKDAVSLVSFLPSYIHVFDTYKEEQNLSAGMRRKSKFICSENDRHFPLSAVLFARSSNYDWAFHIGEWWSPEFVATKIRSVSKAIWIHNDLSEAEYFDDEAFFSYNDYFQKYIFVSNSSLNASIIAYPFIRNKSVCIYNLNDVDFIKQQSQKSILSDELLPIVRPLIVTCANIRPQKKHLRQLEVAKKLRDSGINFTWINIGATSDLSLTQALEKKIEDYQMQDQFLILGAKENPYPYIAQADIVAVLSDYESWSMTITEAKILNTPIISTRTSGALEQIEDGVTGILTDFDENDIAKKLTTMLLSANLRETIRENLAKSSAIGVEKVIGAFNDLVLAAPSKSTASKSLLYVIDDINYSGGAHIATKMQINKLAESGWNTVVFSSTVPRVAVRNELPDTVFLGWKDCQADTLFQRRITDCLCDKDLSFEEKRLKIKMTWASKVKKSPISHIFAEYVQPSLSLLFSEFDTVCVMSEGSSFRLQVAKSSCKRKIQYIHTDYVSWRNLSDFTRETSANDETLYEDFDVIVLLSESIRRSFNALYPSLANKTIVNQNLIPAEAIRKKSCIASPIGFPVNFVTVGRFDFGKGYARLLKVLEKLCNEGYQFHYTIIGDGEDFNSISRKITYGSLANRITLLGQLENPHPYIKNADVFTLFSRYEGLPNTIYEALILGVPVIATDVGGIDSQVIPGENGWLVPNSEKGIYDGLTHILTHPEEIENYKENLKNYVYDNETIYKKTERILFGSDMTE